MTRDDVRHTGNLLPRTPIRGRVIARGDTPASIFCAPNLISMVRILLIPVFVVLLLVDGGANGPMRWAAAIIFVLAIATDAIDGHLARGITVMRSALLKNRVIPASKGGKLKTVAQSVALSFALLPFASLTTSTALDVLFFWINVVTMTIAVALTVVTGIDYVIKAVQAKPKPADANA